MNSFRISKKRFVFHLNGNYVMFVCSFVCSAFSVLPFIGFEHLYIWIVCLFRGSLPLFESNHRYFCKRSECTTNAYYSESVIGAVCLYTLIIGQMPSYQTLAAEHNERKNKWWKRKERQKRRQKQQFERRCDYYLFKKRSY